MHSIDVVEQVYVAFYRAAASRIAGMRVVDTDEVFFAASGVPHPIGNVVGRTRWGEPISPDQLNARIAETIAWFAAGQLPFVWCVWPSFQPATLTETLCAAALAPFSELPAMTLDLAAAPVVPPPPPGLSIIPVADDTTYEAWREVELAAFEYDPGTAIVFDQMLLAMGYAAPMTHYLALFEGRPAGTATTVTDGDTVGLFNIGTLPSERGKGIGAALTVEALRRARATGCQVAGLLSSDLGYTVYRRLGFVERFRASQFVWAPQP